MIQAGSMGCHSNTLLRWSYSKKKVDAQFAKQNNRYVYMDPRFTSMQIL